MSQLNKQNTKTTRPLRNTPKLNWLTPTPTENFDGVEPYSLANIGLGWAICDTSHSWGKRHFPNPELYHKLFRDRASRDCNAILDLNSQRCKAGVAEIVQHRNTTFVHQRVRKTRFYLSKRQTLATCRTFRNENAARVHGQDYSRGPNWNISWRKVILKLVRK